MGTRQRPATNRSSAYRTKEGRRAGTTAAPGELAMADPGGNQRPILTWHDGGAVSQTRARQVSPAAQSTALTQVPHIDVWPRCPPTHPSQPAIRLAIVQKATQTTELRSSHGR